MNFKGTQFEKEIIVWGVRWYVAYPISYRQLEERMGERSVTVTLVHKLGWFLTKPQRAAPPGLSWSNTRIDSQFLICYILYQRLGEVLLRLLIDSSSLIVLARVRALPALHDIYGRIGLIRSVYDEVVTEGQRKGFADAAIVAKAVEAGWFSQLTLTAEEQRVADAFVKKTSGISHTDAESLACARSRKLTLLIEDRRARNVARAEEISYITIQVFPLYGVVERSLATAQGDDLLTRIGRAMNTDLAVVEALRAAVREIDRSRRKES